MASFEELPKAVQDVIRSYEEKNNNGERSTFKFAPDSTLGISSPIQGDVYPPDTASGTAPDMGALSQAAVQPQAQVPQPATPQGALSQFSGLTVPKMISPQEALAQYLPLNVGDDQRGRYLALAAGLGSVTKTGSFGEQIGNVASAMQQQKVQQEQMRMQYLPHIMQQVAAQQQMEFERQKVNMGLGIAGLGGTPPQGQPPEATAPQGAPVAPQTPTGGIQGVSGVAPVVGSAPSQPSVPSQPAPVAAGPGVQTPTVLAPGVSRQAIGLSLAGMTGPAAMYAKSAELGDFAKQLIQSGMTYGSPQFNAAMAAKNLKETDIPPTALRPGTMFRTGRFNPDGTPIMGFTPPTAPPNSVYVFDATQPLGYRVQEIAGANTSIETAEAAKIRGIKGETSTPLYTKSGQVVPGTEKQAADIAKGVAPGAGTPAAAAGPVESLTTVPQLASQKTATNLADQANDINKAVNTKAESALNQIALLKKIKTEALLTPTGRFAPSIELANNILAVVGSKSAANMVAAAEEARKATGQLVAGQRIGSMGTDQAGALLQSITPNTTMQGAALANVADNLIGSRQMEIANRDAIQKHYTAGNNREVVEAHKIFTDNADYPLFEHWHKWQNLGPGTKAAKDYAATLDPSERQRMGVLANMGVLK